MKPCLILLLAWLVASVSACGRLTSPSAPIATQEMRLTPAEDSILVLQGAWVQSALRGESEASAAFMADSFRLVAPGGLVFPKQDWLENSRASRQPYDSVAYDHVHVHIYGDYAVLSGEYTQRTTAAGHKITGHGVTVSMWVNDGTRWRVLASVYPGRARRP
jgi:hypothetical protein